MTFHVGQKVVCLRDGWDRGPITLLRTPPPKVGCEYTIRSIIAADDGSDGVGLRFHWLFAPTLKDGVEAAWGSIGLDGKPNFRPVTETKTDISTFTEILDRENAKPRDKVRA